MTRRKRGTIFPFAAFDAKASNSVPAAATDADPTAQKVRVGVENSAG